jgi:hypothetical protein
MKKIILTGIMIAPLSLLAMNKAEMIEYSAQKAGVKAAEVKIDDMSIQSNWLSDQWTVEIKGKTYYCSENFMTGGCTSAPSFAGG